MKTSSKTFDKSKVYIKNSLSEEEMDDASKRFCEHEGPYLTLEDVFKIEKSKAKQSSRTV